MQGIPARARRPKADTQPAQMLPLKSRLLMLYGGGIARESVACLNQFVARTTLAPRIIDVETQRLSAREAIAQLTQDSDAGAHLMLCIHGAAAPYSKGDLRKGRHVLNFDERVADPLPTEQLLGWLTEELSAADKGPPGTPVTLPFVHLFSCQSGILRKHIQPGSALWRKAYYLVYSSKRSTSLSACGNAMTTAMRYVDWCQRNRGKVDPLKLLYLAGLRRGECMTLMGGDLAAPLVWHAPKSEADLSDQRSLAAIHGHAGDIARLHEQAAALSPAERALLPQASLRELLSSRMERDDAAAVAVLLDAHPALLDQGCIQDVPPVVEAAEKRAHRCLAALLERGANPNALAGNTSALETCVIAPGRNLQGLALLLAHGADPDFADAAGYTALTLAVDVEWAAGIDCLLAHGARMDIKADGLTCLEAAVLNGRAHSVQWLLKAGAGAAEGLSTALMQEALADGHTGIAAALGAALMKQQGLHSSQ